MRAIPDFNETARLRDLSEQAASEGVKIRSIRHSCGHTQGHRVKDGFLARDEYKQFAHQPCGACSRGGDMLVDDDAHCYDDDEYDAEELQP